MNNTRYFFLMSTLIFLSGLATLSQAQTYTWTGNTDTDWEKSTNWTGASGTPTAGSSVIIPNQANDPIISHDYVITISELQVEASAVLTIETSGVLSVTKSASGNTDTCITNDGTIINEGVINLTEDGVATNPALQNNGIFRNRAEGNLANAGELNINDVSGTGITNSGGTFRNLSNAEINISNIGGTYGINATGTFTNFGRIAIAGVNNESFRYAIRSSGSSSTFTNSSTGLIDITKCGNGILVRAGATMNNNGPIYCDEITNISIATSSSSGSIPTFNNTASGEININQRSVTTAAAGIVVQETFFNNIGGRINIDRTSADGVDSRGIQISASSIFRNEEGGLITLGALDNNLGSDAMLVLGDGTFLNASCAGIINYSTQDGLRLASPNLGTFTNNGWIQSYCNQNSSISANNGTIVNYGNGDFAFDGGINNPPIDAGFYTHIWTGAGDADWSNLCNWASGTLPDADATVWVQREFFNPVLTTDTEISALKIADGSRLTINSGVIFTVDGSPGVGVWVEGGLINNGALLIDNALTTGLQVSNSFSLSGITRIGETVNEDGTSILTEDGTVLSINSCAEVYAQDPLMLDGGIINNGFLFINTTTSHSGSDEIQNNAVINFPLGKSGLTVSNSGLLIAPFSLTTGCSASDVLDIGPANSFTAATTWYSNESQTTELGIYNTIDNSLALSISPSPGTQQVYFRVSGNACTFNAQTQYTLEAPSNNTITWSGEVDSEWASPCNWNPALVPTVNEDVIIPNRTNSPIVRDDVSARAKSLQVQPNALLTIEFGGGLIIENSEGDGLHNSGTIDNQFNGVIGIINAAGNAIYNAGGTFNTQGRMVIIEPDGHGIVNESGIFTNIREGDIEIIMDQSPAGKNGIELLGGDFINDFDADIISTALNGYSFNVSNGTLSNEGEISSFGDFNIAAGGTLTTIVNGTNQGNGQFGEIRADGGTGNLDGTLNTIFNYTPNFGDRIPFINSANSIAGAFATENLPNNNWSTDYSVNSEVALNFLNPLPVEMVQFSARAVDKQVELEWQTATELNNKGFEVEYSTDGIQWEQIGFVPGNGTVFSLQHYSFKHHNPNSGLNYYRLRQVDFDDAYEYSIIRSVQLGEISTAIALYPNPASSHLNLKIDNSFSQVLIRITNMRGRGVYAAFASPEQALQVINVQDLSTGLYLMVMEVNGQVYTQKFSVVH